MALSLEDIQERRNKTFRDHYHRALGLLLILCVIGIALAALVTYKLWTRPEPNYYATTTNGDVIPLYSLSEPVVTNTYLLEWASLVARGAYNFDFINYQDRLQSLAGYFTPEGWQGFLSAMQTGVLKTVQSQKLQVSSVVNGAPIILDTALVHGYFTWVVKLPLLVTYASANQSTQEQLSVIMVIRRVPTLDAEKGIQVGSFVVSK